MKVLFVAKHGSGDNQDEDAVAYALRELGHEVRCVHELRRYRGGIDVVREAKLGGYDFCLGFKWETVSEIAEVARHVPYVFWYFDLISNDDDPTLARRMDQRRRWFADVIPHCLTAFCTDGDWVASWNETGKGIARDGGENVLPDIHWLTQGMDERVAGFGTPISESGDRPWPEIVFTGMINHGRRRAEHVASLKERYGNRFYVLGDSGPRRRLHGRALADYFASVKVVVAPDGPSTDRYWSNRVYNTLGLGGFLLHPYCKGLLTHYSPAELTYYSDRGHLGELIDACLDKPDHRRDMARKGYEATLERNLYRHRAEELVRVVKGLL